MATKLFAVANATGQDAMLTSSENPGTDNCAIPAFEITHTGGKDGNFIRIPDCSDSGYWGDHHITVAAKDGSWATSFWDNDDADHVFQWSPEDDYSSGHTVGGSDQYVDCVLLIETSSDGGHPTVHCTQWD